MRIFYKIIIFFTLTFFHSNILLAELPHYLDFKYILNKSEAGSKAQKALKDELQKKIKSLNSKEKEIQAEEKKIIEQKKIISEEEYKKRITELRTKVSELIHI